MALDTQIFEDFMHSYRTRLKTNCQRVAAGPSESSTSVSEPIDGGHLGDLVPDILFFIDAPALDGSQLPDGATLTYTLLESRDAHFRDVQSSTVLGVQAGAGGVGAVAAAFCARPAFRGGNFFGLRVDASAGVHVKSERFALQVALTGTPA
jgi:hypothetical protein